MMARKNFIRKLANRIQTIFAAAAYAESGELETARQIMGEEQAERQTGSIRQITNQTAVRNRPRVS
jgi:hypothetical protein